MFPVHLEMAFLDGHVFMECNHVRAFVVVRATEFTNEVQRYCVVQFWDITDVLQPKRIESIVGKSVLIELSHNESEVFLSSYPI